MKKQTALNFLVNNVGEWPRKIGMTPVISGFRWCRGESELFLFDNHAHKSTCEKLSDVKITKTEWMNAVADRYANECGSLKSKASIIKYLHSKGYQVEASTVNLLMEAIIAGEWEGVRFTL